MITILAPAKINLTLEVLGKRADGYHEVRSVMQAISLYDRLSFEPSERIEYRSDSPGWSAKKSLVSVAVRLLQETGACSRGAVVTMEKHIPMSGGLGGESSAAAATLRGLDQLWGLGLSPEQLVELARQLGSDVPFFFDGDTAMVEGRGEIVKPLPPLSRMWVILVVPAIPQLPEKTRQLYASLNASHYTDGSITQRLVSEITRGNEPDPGLLFNVFESVADGAFPRLSAYGERMTQAGAPYVHLAGSGPALFTMLKDKAQADHLHLRLKAQKFEVYLAEIGGPKL